MNQRLCKRTKAIYKPGQVLPDIYCEYHWNGDYPCTGRYVCYLCGEEPPKDDGRLALGTRERDDQERYFGEGQEPEQENDNE